MTRLTLADLSPASREQMMAQHGITDKMNWRIECF